MSRSIEETLQMVPNPKKRFRTLMIRSAIIAAIVGGAGGWYYLHSRTDKTPQFKQERLEQRTLTTTVSATGNLEPTNSVDVGIEVSGTIREILVDYNDRITKGEVMARLDTTKLEASMASSQASLTRYNANAAEAKASLVYAQNDWERVKKMVESTGGNYPSRQEVDNTKATLDKAKAQYDAALAQVKQASDELATNRYNLNKATVVAPISGIILERKVDVGQTVVAAMTIPVLFTMAEDLTKMKAILSVDEADIGEVKDGQRVFFTVDAYPEKQFEGKIVQTRLNAQTENGVVTYEVVVEVNNDNLLLRPGMTVSATIQTDTLQNVLSVPNAALRFTPRLSTEKPETQKENTEAKTPHVWILKNGKPVRTDIKTFKSDGTYTVIAPGSLKPGDSVLTGTLNP